MDTVIARDFASGVSAEDVPDVGMIQGEEVMLARRGDEFFAAGMKCPHYAGLLGKGLQKGRYPRPA